MAGGLSPRQLRAIELIAIGSTQSATAKTIGVSEQTVSKYMQDPDFQAALREKVEQIAEPARLLYMAQALKAADVNAELLDSKNDNVRLGAVRDVMARVFESSEHVEALPEDLDAEIMSEVHDGGNG